MAERVAHRPPYSGEEKDRSALPRFQLPDSDPADPVEAARTAERPALSNLVRGRRPQIRKSLPAIHVPSEPSQEVAPEDILLEAYVEPPPSRVPETKRSVPPPPRASKQTIPPPPITERLPMPSGPSSSYFATEMLGTPPPQGAPMMASTYPSRHPNAVDELLAMSASPSQVPRSMETPSVAPVVYSMHSMTSATPIVDLSAKLPKKQQNRVLFSITLVTLGIMFGAFVALALPPGALARVRSGIAAKPAAPPPPVTIVVTSPPPPPSAVPPIMPTVAVDALPKPAVSIEPNMTLITFPPSAIGHRVYVDRGVLMNSPAQAKIKCGKRKIRIGSEGKARTVHCPCGGELVLE